jgi:hypothetical protein
MTGRSAPCVGFRSAEAASRASRIPTRAIVKAIKNGWLAADQSTGRYRIRFDVFADFEHRYKYWGRRLKVVR